MFIIIIVLYLMCLFSHSVFTVLISMNTVYMVSVSICQIK